VCIFILNAMVFSQTAVVRNLQINHARRQSVPSIIIFMRAISVGFIIPGKHATYFLASSACSSG